MPLKDDLHNFVDSHIREIQYSVYGIGALGLFFVIRDLRLATTFRHVSDIPPKFITSHVTLQGRVQEVSRSGSLYVQHQPVFTLPFSGWIHHLRSGTHEPGTLTVEVAGVEMTAGARQWLSQHVTGRHVWFTLLQASSQSQSLLCSVYQKKNVLRKLHLNEMVVKEGLAPVLLDPCLTADNDPRVQTLLSRLLAAQQAAQKRQKGVWKESSGDERLRKPSVFGRVFGWLKVRLKRLIGRKEGGGGGGDS